MTWIYCNDKEPPEDIRLLLCDKDFRIFVAKRDGESFLEGDGSNDFHVWASHIFAWQHLPQPPFVNQTITNDDWVQLIAKKGLLK